MQRSIFLALIITLAVVGCGKPAPEEYLTKATEAREAKNPSQAIEQYEKLITDHPGTKEAEEALFHIASVRNDDMKDFGAAVEAYKRYLEQYPQGTYAPVAMFLSGYLLNNELGDTLQAKATYEQFVASYPEHELVESARFEIMHLGKKPEDIIPSSTPEPQVTAAPAKKTTKRN